MNDCYAKATAAAAAAAATLSRQRRDERTGSAGGCIVTKATPLYPRKQ